MNSQLDTFDLIDIKPNTHINIIGLRGTGKTYLVKNIIHILKIKYNCTCMIVSPSSMMYYYYDFHRDDHLFFSINNLLANTELIMLTTIIVLDDCIDNLHGGYYHPDVVELFSHNFHNIITIHHRPIHNPYIKYDINFLFKINFLCNIERIYNDMINIKLYSIEDFLDILNKSTTNYHVLAIQKNNPLMISSAENITTYDLYYKNCGLYHNRIVTLLNRIQCGYSMYYDKISYKLRDNLEYIKCCCTWLCLRNSSEITVRMPPEIYFTICEIMILVYSGVQTFHVLLIITSDKLQTN